MFNGAHFHCCDLQVHSPRDIGWTGNRPVTEDERAQFANDFIAACRRKGLEAVAITDHHDLQFCPYIRRAAAAEATAAGTPVPENERIVIFAGMELTLGKAACQAIVLFDPDLDDISVARAAPALGIAMSPRDAASILQPRRLPLDLNDVHERLTGDPILRGRFILLPNVNHDGEDSVLRNGFQEHYKRMPCVGGFVDGPFGNHRKTHILNGQDPNWGNKRIGVLQTSDARDSQFQRLGTAPTWIKWSVASVEAIRQACLAPESKIRYERPVLPTTWITDLVVSNSRYFGPFRVVFNPQVSALIGGRGSGKSTVLEYLRWALCDQPYVHEDDEEGELPDYERRRKALVSNTLRTTGAEVTVGLVSHDTRYNVRREAGTGMLFLSISGGPEKETTEQLVQSLGAIQGYSQKQLSHVSVRKKELLRLLTTPIAQDLATIRAHREEHASSLRQAFERDESKLTLSALLQSIELDLQSKQEQLKRLQEQMTGLPAEHRQVIAEHSRFLAGKRLLDSYTESAQKAVDAVDKVAQEIDGLATSLQQVSDALPGDIISELRQLLAEALGRLSRDLITSRESFGGIQDPFNERVARADTAYEAHAAEYSAASSASEFVQKQLDEMRGLASTADKVIADRDATLAKIAVLGDTAADLRRNRELWTHTIGEETELLEREAGKLTADSLGELRVRLQRGADLDEVKEGFFAALRGAGITTPDKITKLLDSVATATDPVGCWLDIANEMLSLARCAPRLPTGGELASTPLLARAGFIGSELRRIAGKISPEAAFALSLFFPKSVPVFEYRASDGQYVPFESASPGQQADALISLLLNQSSGPLIIDQPEDDLDNATIQNVSERIWGAKQKRQLILSTHNPNIVVIGDAELVLQCDYCPPKSPNRIYMPVQGSIDQAEVKEAVKRVMEGGEAAFKLRMEKYGF